MAQQTSTQVEERLREVKVEKGAVSLDYATTLLTLTKIYQVEENFKKVKELDKELQKILKQLNNKSLKGQNAASFNEKVEDLCLKQTLINWQSLMHQNEYEDAQEFLIENNWLKRCVINKSHDVLLDLLEQTHLKLGSLHLHYLNNWEIAYHLYANSKQANNTQCEKMWQQINKHRIKETKEESKEHLEVLFGYASFCDRTKQIERYQQLRSKIEKHWPFAFKKAPNKVDASKTNISPSKTNENSSEKSIPPPPSGMFGYIEQMPRFPGCEALDDKASSKKKCADQKLLKFIYTNLKYPSAAKENNIEGMSVISFSITIYGTIIESKIVRSSSNANLDEEALRIIRSMNELPSRWSPGVQRDKVVSVQYNMPIRFKMY